ncbi:MAG: SusD/RagB family nutrient-binding outer membrane lipoprotein [Bacteroidales bacterium]|jgi:hypothetical protein|nr:SusD/RagB family nutrient-binding outer membrane lipoprotein [Bacteroidales bacterium]
MKKIISFIILAGLMIGCTERFDIVNTNPYRISDEALEQDNNHLGAAFATMLSRLTGDQTMENLATDDFVRHMGTPTAFENNRNNTTYYPVDGWNSAFWNRIYNDVMSPAQQIKTNALAEDNIMFATWADLMQVLGLSRLTVYHGPLIYSNYGSKASTILYDSEEELYKLLFAKLDEIQKIFEANKTYPYMKKFDASYGGDVTKWIRLINTMRLRLAMRIVKADPVMAKEQGEKAINDATKAGLILANRDNFILSLYGAVMPMSQICFSWNDTRMGAGMEEFLLGYNDPRLSKYFQPVKDDNLYADHPNQPYKGIASGSYIVRKTDREPYSLVSEAWKSATGRRFFTAAETNFILAEAALRGWNVPKTAQEYYEEAVRQSFADWEADGADVYLADDTSKPIDYVDPSDARNNYKTRSTITIKWDEAATDEEKLERIMTQKWIDSFTNANEIWSDHRRTGYPKLHYVPKNDSNATWGIIPADGFLLRMPFVLAERDNNPNGVTDATQKLGGENLISTRLWIHPDKPNF